MVLPPNSIPLYVLLVPLRTLEGGPNELKFYMYSDPQFTTSYPIWSTPVFDYPKGVLTSNELNNNCIVPVAGSNVTFNNFTPYPYNGFEMQGEVTAGFFMAYVFYEKGL